MTSRRILLGLGLGILTGIFLGEQAAIFGIAADAFVKLLQMTVLPYVTVSWAVVVPQPRVIKVPLAFPSRIMTRPGPRSSTRGSS